MEYVRELLSAVWSGSMFSYSYWVPGANILAMILPTSELLDKWQVKICLVTWQDKTFFRWRKGVEGDDFLEDEREELILF